MAPTSKDFDKANALLQSVAWQMGGKVYMERLDDIRDALATVDANEAATEAREKKSGRKYKKLTEEQLAFKLEISPVELSRLRKIIKFPRLQVPAPLFLSVRDVSIVFHHLNRMRRTYSNPTRRWRSAARSPSPSSTSGRWTTRGGWTGTR